MRFNGQFLAGESKFAQKWSSFICNCWFRFQSGRDFEANLSDLGFLRNSDLSLDMQVNQISPQPLP